MDPRWPAVALGWCLGAWCALALLYWLAALGFTWAGRRAAPRPAEGLRATPARWPRLSIVMPAHNEQRVIGESLSALLASDYPDFEVIVAADRCTDATVEIVKRHAATDPRLRVVEIGACPEGWTGKCHACWRGYRAAGGELLLFLDADAIVAPDLLRAAVGLLLQRDYALLSLLGRLPHRQEFERTEQPVAAMALMKMFPLHRANRPDPVRRRPFANGQFLLFRRDAYERVGTHEGVKHRMLEDMAFAMRITKAGLPLGVGLGEKRFTVRMYDDAGAFRRGWKRIFIECANHNVRRLRLAGMRLRVLSLAPVGQAGAAALGVTAIFWDRPLAAALLGLAGASIAVQAAVLAWAYSLIGTPVRWIVRYPRGAWSVGGLLIEAARDLRFGRGVEWAGLRYAPKERVER